MTVIRRRLVLLKQYIDILEGLRDKVSSPDDLRRDVVLRGAVERYLYLTVEALIDIGLHICLELGLRKPERYREIAYILGEKNIIDDRLSKIFESWIGFRNILVYVYSRINISKIFEALNSIDEIKSLVSQISSKAMEMKMDPIHDDVVKSICSVLCKDMNVLAIYIFGSYVSGRFSERSDIDIAVYMDGQIGWKKIVEMKYMLEDVLDRRVDLILLNDADLELAYMILSEGRRIFVRDVERVAEFEVKIVKKYLDMKPRLEEYYRKVIRKIIDEWR